jgi:hypothetical protein
MLASNVCVAAAVEGVLVICVTAVFLATDSTAHLTLYIFTRSRNELGFILISVVLYGSAIMVHVFYMFKALVSSGKDPRMTSTSRPSHRVWNAVERPPLTHKWHRYTHRCVALTMSISTCVPNCNTNIDRRLSKGREVVCLCLMRVCERERERVTTRGGRLPNRKRKHHSKEVGKRHVKKPPA